MICVVPLIWGIWRLVLLTLAALVCRLFVLCRMLVLWRLVRQLGFYLRLVAMQLFFGRLFSLLVLFLLPLDDLHL